MEQKHAYMIMAHHRPDLLKMLIEAIDDARNDIFIHIDKKSSMTLDLFKTKKAKLIFTDQIDVRWAGYSQVECEYRLLETALKFGKHSYYHFFTGVTYPLWNQDYLHEFFIQNAGKEFIGFDNARDYSDRTRYYYFYPEYGKLTGIKGRTISAVRSFLIALQKVFKIDRLKNSNLVIKKGCAYWSITESLAQYILEQEINIRMLLKNTIWCDEVFVQTLAFNSTFRDNIYNSRDEYDGAMREFAWPSNIAGVHPGWNFGISDLDYLLNSKRLFSLKFEALDGVQLINEIQDRKGIKLD